jgi:hypothetical protein
MTNFKIYKYKVKDWNKVKQELLLCYGETSTHIIGDGKDKVLTNWNTDFRSKIHTQEGISRILFDEINRFMFDFKINYQITDAWFQQYEKNMAHGVHDHGEGYSCVVYIEFDPKIHHSTIFVDDDGRETNLDVEEGDMIFFDSSHKHKCPPNKTDKRRTICSFNLKSINFRYF